MIFMFRIGLGTQSAQHPVFPELKVSNSDAKLVILL